MPDCLACRKIFVSRTTGSVPAVSRSRTPAHRGQLVYVSGQQQVGARRHRLDQLVGQDDIHHRGFVHHDQVGVQRCAGVERRLAAQPQQR
jgi:hypothetical protein